MTSKKGGCRGRTAVPRSVTCALCSPSSSQGRLTAPALDRGGTVRLCDRKRPRGLGAAVAGPMGHVAEPVRCVSFGHRAQGSARSALDRGPPCGRGHQQGPRTGDSPWKCLGHWLPPPGSHSKAGLFGRKPFRAPGLPLQPVSPAIPPGSWVPGSGSLLLPSRAGSVLPVLAWGRLGS